mmetsp:Transcript_13120/g.17936  ORF Transcript_13120/g.17936 Transcript_13120/m.17936 type:complete len:150 (+) Transcript_13120:195-644(+)
MGKPEGKTFDWNIKAVKIFIADLLCCIKSLEVGSNILCFQLSNSVLKFQRVWIQGVVVEAGPGTTVVIDDGSGSIEVCCRAYFKKQSELQGLKKGMYVQIIGAPAFLHDKLFLRAAKVQDLSKNPQREAIWYLEVLHLRTHDSESVSDG